MTGGRLMGRPAAHRPRPPRVAAAATEPLEREKVTDTAGTNTAESGRPEGDAPASLNGVTYLERFTAVTTLLTNIGDALQQLDDTGMRTFLDAEIAPLYPGQPLQAGGILYPHVVVLDAVAEVRRVLQAAGDSYRDAIEQNDQKTQPGAVPEAPAAAPPPPTT